MEKFLKKLGLEPDAINAILKETAKVENELLATKNDLLTAQKEVSRLEGFEATNKTLKSDFEALEAKYSDYKSTAKKDIDNLNSQISDNLKTYSIKNEMLKRGVEYADLLIDKFDKSSLKVDEHNVVSGIEEQFEKLKEQYPKLCTPQMSKNHIQGVQPAQGVQSPESLNLATMSAEDVANIWGDLKKSFR